MKLRSLIALIFITNQVIDSKVSEGWYLEVVNFWSIFWNNSYLNCGYGRKWRMIIAAIFQFKQLERRSLKKTGFRDSNPWPPRYRCDALPTQLWSHTLGARSIYWVQWIDMKYELFLYTSHHFTPHGRYELNKLTSLPMCGFIVSWLSIAPVFAQVPGSNPVNWKIYRDDHSSLSSILMFTSGKPVSKNVYFFHFHS